MSPDRFIYSPKLQPRVVLERIDVGDWPEHQEDPLAPVIDLTQPVPADDANDLGVQTEAVPVAVVQVYPPQVTSVGTQTDAVITVPAKGVSVQTSQPLVKSVGTQTEGVVEAEIKSVGIQTDHVGQDLEADFEQLDYVGPTGVKPECEDLHSSISGNLRAIDATADEVIYILDQLLLMYP